MYRILKQPRSNGIVIFAGNVGFMEIAALVSGGVDSSVTIPLLKEAGLDPVICYIRITLADDPAFKGCPQEEDMEITSYLARKYGCRLEVVDLEQEYREQIISYLIDAVSKGLTPNPDVLCNRLIKFGAFEEKFGKHFDMITTGHYASTQEYQGIKWLTTAADRHKDQTYFLSRITSPQLKKLHFPLGHLMKQEVRDLAEREALPSAHRPDSQGICFLGEINYNEFIARYIGEKPGKIVEWETGRILGQHKGYWFHTIGQRKGLGLPQGPWFVVRKETADNIIFVSNGYDPVSQYREQIVLQDFLFIAGNPLENDPFPWEVSLKIRHTPEFLKASITAYENGVMRINPHMPVPGVAPGQFGVIYDADNRRCLGSGVIMED